MGPASVYIREQGVLQGSSRAPPEDWVQAIVLAGAWLMTRRQADTLAVDCLQPGGGVSTGETDILTQQ